MFVWYSTWATQFVYSIPALVVPGRTAEGAPVALNDLEDAMRFFSTVIFGEFVQRQMGVNL